VLNNGVCAVRVLIDQLITSDRPDLQRAAQRKHPDVKFDSFDFLSAARSIGAALDRAWPDVVVVDRVWLHLSSLLHRILTSGGHTLPRVVIASRHVDEVFRVQVAHRGFTDYIDLDDPAEDLVVQLCEIHAGTTRHTDDKLWASVPLPSVVDDLDKTPRDDLDREILSLICVGMQDVDIANVVHLSTQTVKNRISAMLERSGLRNRTQLAWMQANQAVGDAVSRSLGYQGRRGDTSTVTTHLRRMPSAERTAS
jgi:DNA-binding NarL/FixJ family response regulator